MRVSVLQQVPDELVTRVASAANYLDLTGLFKFCFSKASQATAIDLFKLACFLEDNSLAETLPSKFPEGWKNDADTLSSFASQEIQIIVPLLQTKIERLNLLVNWVKSQSEADNASMLLDTLKELSSRNFSLIALNRYQFRIFMQPMIESITNSTETENYYREKFREVLLLDVADTISRIVQNGSTFQELTKFIIQRETPNYEINDWISGTSNDSELTFSLATRGFELEKDETPTGNENLHLVSTNSSKHNKLRQFLHWPSKQIARKRLRQPIKQKEDKALENEIQTEIRRPAKEAIISVKWTLLFRASEHDYKNAAFHEYCDNKGPTITLVKTSKGQIFTGYAGISWKLNHHEKNAKGFIAEIGDANLRKYDASSTAEISSYLNLGPRFLGSYSGAAFHVEISGISSYRGIFGATSVDVTHTHDYYDDYYYDYNGFFQTLEYEVFKIEFEEML